MKKKSMKKSMKGRAVSKGKPTSFMSNQTPALHARILKKVDKRMKPKKIMQK